MPWGLWGGWGLGSTEQKRPRRASHPCLRGQEPHLGAQQASWFQVGETNALCSSTAPPGGPLPPASPDLLTSLLCPQDQCGRGGGALEGRGPAWEPSRLPRPEWLGQSPPLLLLLEGLSHLPLLISPASGSLILSGLHFSSPLSTPTSYQFTWGFLLSPWASGSPTSSQQVP